MKKYRLKINYFTCSNDAIVKDVFKKGEVLNYDESGEFYYRKNSDGISTYPKIFIEKNTDIFELIPEPEPQEEVIEGYACYQDELDVYYFTNENGRMVKDIPATLILNPKKKKEINTLPDIDKAGAIAVGIIEESNPIPTAAQQAYFIAGFQECIKWLKMQNPKKKKEYVRWADDDELRDFEKVGLNTYLECKKSEQFCHKIKITVEDSE